MRFIFWLQSTRCSTPGDPPWAGREPCKMCIRDSPGAGLSALASSSPAMQLVVLRLPAKRFALSVSSPAHGSCFPKQAESPALVSPRRRESPASVPCAGKAARGKEFPSTTRSLIHIWWMNRAMASFFPGVQPETFGPYAGVAQQALFVYSRNHPELLREPARGAAKKRKS